MARDDFLINIITDEWKKASRDMDRVAQKAAMWAVRESARKLARAAQKVAPVYRGAPRMVRAGSRRVQLVPGAYKKSIKSSRRFSRSVSGTYTLKVGPRGGSLGHVNLYAQKIERRSQPIGTAYAAIKGQVPDIHEGALRRAWAKYGK